jgi:hypothetical protein
VSRPALRDIDPNGPILRMHVKEYLAKIDAAADRLDAAEAAWKAAQAQFEYELDLIDLNYYGPRWLVDGKVGWWDEPEEE